MANLTPEDYYKNRPMAVIRPVDAAFIQDISEELNMQCGLSLNIDPKKVIQVIRKVALYCYDHFQYQSLIQKPLVLRNTDFKDSYSANGGMYASVYLPNAVHGLYNIGYTNNGNWDGSKRILDIPILRSVALSTAASGSSVNINTQDNYNYSTSDATIALYEMSAYQDKFTGGIPFSFNPASGEFVIKVKTCHNIVLGAFVKVDISSLYHNFYFRQHVMGECMIQSARIFGVFNIELGGNATINYGDIKDDGKELVDECKEHYKATSTMPRTFFKK